MAPQRAALLDRQRQALAQARLDELRQAAGRFTCCTRKQQAGGSVVAASGGLQDSLAQFHRDLDHEAARSWQTLDRWWTWSTERGQGSGVRFAGLRRLAAGVCRARRDGVRCSNAGIPGTDGHNLCAPCRGALSPDSFARCDCCGGAADSDGIANWVAIGRWPMVCPNCVVAVGALPISHCCDNCMEPATRVTADGSNACAACMDTFSQRRVWLARSKILVRRAQQRMGIAPVSPHLERALWLHAAAQWAVGHLFCGDAIQWRQICETVAAWWAQHGVRGASGLSAAADAHLPAWQPTQPALPTVKQSTLPNHGFQGKQLAIRRPLHRRHHGRPTVPASPPRPPPAPPPTPRPPPPTSPAPLPPTSPAPRGAEWPPVPLPERTRRTAQRGAGRPRVGTATRPRRPPKSATTTPEKATTSPAPRAPAADTAAPRRPRLHPRCDRANREPD
jgi:hypothetical protein